MQSGRNRFAHGRKSLGSDWSDEGEDVAVAGKDGNVPTDAIFLLAGIWPITLLISEQARTLPPSTLST